MKKKKRNKNLINVLSFLNEAVETEKTKKINFLLSQPLNRKNLLELYNLRLNQEEMTDEIFDLLSSKETEINNILNSVEIKSDPSYKAGKLEKVQKKFEDLFKNAKEQLERKKEIKKIVEEEKPFNDYFQKIIRAYQPFSISTKELSETPDGNSFIDEILKEKAKHVSKDGFKTFLLNILDSRVKEDYQKYKQNGEKYKEYLGNYIKTIEKDVTDRVNKQLNKTSLPEIQPIRQIPQIQLPQEEPPTSPTSILGQIGRGVKKGVEGARALVGLEEEVIKQESLQESLKLKTLSLKEAMEKEYD
jgi:hypothetical protein